MIFWKPVICILFFVIPFSILSQIKWEPFPIRSKAEFESNNFGGEGEQYLHSIDRCLNVPGTIYLAHDVGGSWKSTDGGKSWKKNLDKGLYNVHSQAIAVDPVNPDIAFIIVDNGWMEQGTVKQFQGIYKTTDGGESWEHVLFTDVENVRVLRNTIAYQPTTMLTANHSPKTWYAVFNNNGLYKSENYGEKGTWVKLVGLNTSAHQVVCHPTDSNVVFVATDNGLFKSDDKGSNLKSWKFSGQKVSSVVINKNNGNIYAAVTDQGLFVSTDSENFKKLTVKVNYNNVLVDVSDKIQRVTINPGYPEQIYFITGNSQKEFRTCVSEDGGKTEIWKYFEDAITFPGLGRENGWRRWIDNTRGGISPNPKDKSEAIAIARSTIFRCEIQQNKVRVIESATGFTGNAPSWWAKSMAFHPFDSDKFAFFCLDVGPNVTHTGGQWFQERDNKIGNWKWIDGLIEWTGSYSGAFQPLKGSSLIVASIGMYNGRSHLMRSEDLGLNWELVTVTQANKESQMHSYEFIEFDPNDPKIVYAGYQVSSDAGRNFNPIKFPPEYFVDWGTKPNFRTPYLVGLTNENGKTYLFAISRDNKTILRSNDKGISWIKFADLRQAGSVAAFMNGIPVFTTHPTNPNVVFTLDKNHDLLKVEYHPSVNQTTYTSLKLFDYYSGIVPKEVMGFNQIACIAIHPKQPDTMYVSMLASGIPGVLESIDGGNNWRIISENTAHLGNTMLFVNPHNGDLYRGSIMGVEKYSKSAITTLKQTMVDDANFIVYPNPANQKIIVENAAGSDIEIYNLTGQLMLKTVAFSEKRTIIDVSNLNSGIYIIKSGKKSKRIIIA
jgi:photosystem II stability/assembly factor-like uncharacterized protein